MQADNFGRKWLARMALTAFAGAGVCAGGPQALAKVHHASHHSVATAPQFGSGSGSGGPSGGGPVGTSPVNTGQFSSSQFSNVQASGLRMSDAEKLRRLDIMLLVTGLRCRATADDFQPDFETFEAHHRRDLNLADRQLRLQFGGRHGAVVSAKAMDHINVEMANVYGNGHPWMGCHDLKGVVHDLAGMTGTRPLLTVADQLLASPAITAQP